MQLVDENNDIFGFDNLSHDRLESLFELAAILGACDQRGHVKGNNPLVFQSLGDISFNDALCQSLGNCRLADTRLTDQHRVVFLASGKNLANTLDLVFAPDYGVKFAAARQFRQVPAKMVQGGSL